MKCRSPMSASWSLSWVYSLWCSMGVVIVVLSHVAQPRINAADELRKFVCKRNCLWLCLERRRARRSLCYGDLGAIRQMHTRRQWNAAILDGGREAHALRVRVSAGGGKT